MRGWEGQWWHLGQRVPEDRTDVNNRKPRPPASVRCALRQPFQLHVSWRLDLYAPKTCWVAGLYVNFTRIWLTYTSASPQRSGLSSRRKVIQNVLSPRLSRSRLCLWSALDLLISARVFSTFQSLRSRSLLRYFFLPIPKKCEILLHFFTQYGKIKYSSLIFGDTDSQFRTLNSPNPKSIEKFFFN